jgi:hypothetical protein
MAQIRIEQKRSSLGWLWLVIALIIVGFIIRFLLGRGTAATELPNTTSPARTPSSQVVPSQDAPSARLAAA